MAKRPGRTIKSTDREARIGRQLGYMLEELKKAAAHEGTPKLQTAFHYSAGAYFIQALSIALERPTKKAAKPKK
jgi:hypothetical protein